MVAKGSGNFRKAAVCLTDRGVRALGMDLLLGKGFVTTRRVSEGFQQKDLTTNNANGTNRNTADSSFA